MIVIIIYIYKYFYYFYLDMELYGLLIMSFIYTTVVNKRNGTGPNGPLVHKLRRV